MKEHRFKFFVLFLVVLSFFSGFHYSYYGLGPKYKNQYFGFGIATAEKLCTVRKHQEGYLIVGETYFFGHDREPEYNNENNSAVVENPGFVVVEVLADQVVIYTDKPVSNQEYVPGYVRFVLVPKRPSSGLGRVQI